jgi:hypothetical protein
MTDDYELIHSPLSRDFTQDGMTVKVHIYRGEDDDGWLLEVVDHENGSTVWDETFSTDAAALEEFLSTVAKDGIAAFLRDPSEKLN